jgi:hypothetical protein
LKYGETSEEVRLLQRQLVAQGYDLPRFGVDGNIGTETMQALVEWDYDHGGVGDPDVSHEYLLDENLDVEPDIIIAVAQAYEAHRSNFAPEYQLVNDVRTETPKHRQKYKNKIEDIDTVCIHQMGAKGRDWKRWQNLAIHGIVTCGEESEAYWMHDVAWRMAHGHGWNRRSVGIEFEGYFAGCHPKFFWKPKSKPNRKPMIPTQQQLDAGKELILFLIEEVKRQGGRIKYIAAHRQSYSLKTSDPGDLIWKGVVVPLLNDASLSLEQAPTLKKGKPIPECWDPTRNKGVKYR